MSLTIFRQPPFAIILNSLVILYLELALIRFLPVHIVYLGFFTNFVFIAAIFGMGLGFLLAKLTFNLNKVFPLVLLILIGIARLFGSGVDVAGSQEIFFQGNLGRDLITIKAYVLLPVLFCLISLVFASLSQTLGRFFAHTKDPIRFYILDILGAIAGIGIFYLGSYFSLPAYVWFFFFSIIFLLITEYKKLMVVIAAALLFVTSILSVDTFKKGVTFTKWSPYYRIDVVKLPDIETWLLYVNNISHQYFTSRLDATTYRYLFTVIKNEGNPREALIIGSGTGQDVQAALDFGVESIDAVEIDPEIYSVGRRLHPEKPYSDPRVNVYINDGRNFLKDSSKKYDLIIFALTDSLILSSGKGGLRLESYLFTLDSFASAREHLTKDGMLVLYNDYREDWLINRLSRMLESVFGSQPKVAAFNKNARIFISKNSDFKPLVINTKNLPTDNWPFLYLKEKTIPPFYLWVFASIFGVIFFVLALIRKRVPGGLKLSRRSLIFFLLGASFSLLEAKSIVSLNLVFGATWIVNGLAFMGILLAVLFACLLAGKSKFASNKTLAVLLIGSLIVQYFVPIKLLLVGNFFLQFVLAIFYFYLPIFFANMIFARLFVKSTSPEKDFAFNLMGLVCGAILEYSALAFGYSSLAIIALLFYIVVLWLSRDV